MQLLELCIYWETMNRVIIIEAFSIKCIQFSISLETRPIKIRPGLYCMGDSAHARTEFPRIWGIRSR